MALKFLFGGDGRIYGAQIVGAQGVDKRIDSIAQAMRNGLSAPQLGELELAYAPPSSSAKDPVNFAGFVAENLLTSMSDAVHADAIPEDAQIVDVRQAEEYSLGAVPGAVNIPLGELRNRLGELDRSRKVVCCCQVGMRGYLAERILKQNGFDAANLSGGYLTWKMFHHERKAPVANVPTAVSQIRDVKTAETLDVRTLPCPGPIIKLKNKMESLPPGGGIHLLAAPAFEGDLRSWAKGTDHTIANFQHKGTHLEADIVKGASSGRVAPAPAAAAPRSAAIVLFSNDLDKALAAFILANGFAAAGAKVSMFFTFWGLSVLRKKPAPPVRKDLISRMFGFMLPKGATKLALSKMHMLGMGSAVMKSVMKKQGVLSLPELIASAREAGVRFVACDMAMGVMGITREELIDIDEIAGVATFAELAKNSGTTLFI